MLLLFFLVFTAFSTAFPSVRNSPYVVHEKRETLGRGWQQKRRLPANTIIPLRIGLSQANLHTGYGRLMEVSHPSSAHYGKYLSREKIHDLFKPADEVVEAVKAWLVEQGVDPSVIVHSENKGWLAMDLPAHHVERLFQTQYYEHEYAETNSVSVGCEQYSLPYHLAEHIDYIRPAVKMSTSFRKRGSTTTKRSEKRTPPKHAHSEPHPQPPAARGLPPDLQHCAVNMTPVCVRALYNIPPGHRATPGNELGIFSQGSYYDASDLQDFLSRFASWVPKSSRPILASIDGGKSPISCKHGPDGYEANCAEADVDIETAISLVYPQKVVNYQVDDPYWAEHGYVFNDFNMFLDALDGSYCNFSAFGITGDSPDIDPKYPDHHHGGYKGERQCGVHTPTKVISISYGATEQNFPKRYRERQCNEFMKLGLQGHSIFVASGDAGVGSYGVLSPPDGCLNSTDPSHHQRVFDPSDPSTCPFITSVGGTMLYPHQTVYDTESVMHSPQVGPTFGSGGGFSNYYSAPRYQKSALKNYFSEHDPGYRFYYANESGTNYGENGGVYNRAGRGYPDVSANGFSFEYIINGSLWHGPSTSGTSLSAPIFASAITLINEEREAVGKGPVGFVNPVLYENAWVLRDITNGTNPACGTRGFPAVRGWDPSTGLGALDYPKMLRLFMSLP